MKLRFRSRRRPYLLFGGLEVVGRGVERRWWLKEKEREVKRRKWRGGRGEGGSAEESSTLSRTPTSPIPIHQAQDVGRFQEEECELTKKRSVGFGKDW